LVWAKVPPRSPVPSPKYMMSRLRRISSAMPSRTASSQLVSGPPDFSAPGSIASAGLSWSAKTWRA
jgi:hypothetical protein